MLVLFYLVSSLNAGVNFGSFFVIVRNSEKDNKEFCGLVFKGTGDAPRNVIMDICYLVIMDIFFSAKQVAYFKALGSRDTSILS